MLLVHDGTLASHDVFEWLLTMLASDVELDFVAIPHMNERVADTEGMLRRDRARQNSLDGKSRCLRPTRKSDPRSFARLS